eukprot:IDg9312t1
MSMIKEMGINKEGSLCATATDPLKKQNCAHVFSACVVFFARFFPCFILDKVFPFANAFISAFQREGKLLYFPSLGPCPDRSPRETCTRIRAIYDPVERDKVPGWDYHIYLHLFCLNLVVAVVAVYERYAAESSSTRVELKLLLVQEQGKVEVDRRQIELSNVLSPEAVLCAICVLRGVTALWL